MSDSDLPAVPSVARPQPADPHAIDALLESLLGDIEDVTHGNYDAETFRVRCGDRWRKKLAEAAGVRPPLDLIARLRQRAATEMPEYIESDVPPEISWAELAEISTLLTEAADALAAASASRLGADPLGYSATSALLLEYRRKVEEPACTKPNCGACLWRNAKLAEIDAALAALAHSLESKVAAEYSNKAGTEATEPSDLVPPSTPIPCGCLSPEPRWRCVKPDGHEGPCSTSENGKGSRIEWPRPRHTCESHR